MSSPNLHPMLNVAIKAARAAGAIINRAALDVESVRISQKQINDFVTEVDHASERVIIETLLTAYPGHGIIAEESGSEHGAKDSEYVWIIDPLDGTTNFIHGFPVYCVSIALAVRGKVEQAVIYDPSRNDLFTSTKGRGAFLNERRIRVSKRTQLKESLLSTGFPFRPGDNFKSYLNMMGDVMQRTAGLRRPGSAALDLAYVAAGYTEGFFETGLSVWDVAAGSLLVTEAGGLIGNPTSWSSANAWQARRASTGNWCRFWANTASSPQREKKPRCARPSKRWHRKKARPTLQISPKTTRRSDRPEAQSGKRCAMLRNSSAISMKASTMSGSNCVPRPLTMATQACSCVPALLYTRWLMMAS